MKDKKKISIDKFSIKEVIVLIVITAAVSLATGFAITSRLLEDKKSDTVVTDNENLDTFIKNYNYIIKNYYGEYDEQKLLDAALAGVLQELDDPYTTYIDENSVNNFNIQLQGNYEGLGIEIYNSNSKIVISKVFTSSPASKAGLQAGDIILSINDKSTSEMKTTDFANIVKENNKFKISVQRNDEIKEISVEKNNVTINSVESQVFNNNNKKIGYLNISIFANNTYGQMKKELESLEESKIDSLIIDVRNNTGGHLTSVENILSLFLDSSHIIYKMEDSEGIKEYYSSGTVTKNYPIIVLTNESSASASEILTAALKVEYGAKSVGKKTYGKGSAQELRTLPDGTQYKFTTRKWLTPKGESIDGIGIPVDFEISMDDSYTNNPTVENDNQLQAAIKIISNE